MDVGVVLLLARIAKVEIGFCSRLIGDWISVLQRKTRVGGRRAITRRAVRHRLEVSCRYREIGAPLPGGRCAIGRNWAAVTRRSVRRWSEGDSHHPERSTPLPGGRLSVGGGGCVITRRVPRRWSGCSCTEAESIRFYPENGASSVCGLVGLGEARTLRERPAPGATHSVAVAHAPLALRGRDAPATRCFTRSSPLLIIPHFPMRPAACFTFRKSSAFSNVSHMDPKKQPDVLNTSLLAVTQTAVGCGLGLLLGGKMSRQAQKTTAFTLLGVGALLALPAVVEALSTLIAGPDTERGAKKSLDSIRHDSGLPDDAEVY